MRRRHFIKFTAQGLLLPRIIDSEIPYFASTSTGDPKFYLFSKHLQFLNYAEMAKATADLGFYGLDLTVRKGGHVEPSRVQEELPKAVEIMQKAGLQSEVMATDVTNAEDVIHRQVLTTASRLGIKFYRLGYLDYVPELSQPARLAKLNQQMHSLAAFNQSLRLTGAYQNHSGKRIGAQIWELHHLLKDIPKEHLGVQYDIRHAMVEGGESWENGLQLIAEQINCLVLKDYYWAKNNAGLWEVVNVPLGQGMVDFKYFFQLIKKSGLHVPMIIHCEYDLGGAEHGAKILTGKNPAEVFTAMARDLQYALDTWRQA